jgi:cysteine desulfurase / selenocysteine lyase
MSIDIAALRAREFPWAAVGEAIYLNAASTGPLPQRTLDATMAFNVARAAPHRLTQEMQFGTLDQSRRLIASLIGASPDEIALATNTSFGINLAAFSLPLRAGDVVLAPDREFPANVYPWMQLAARRGVELRFIECAGGVLDVERLRTALEDERVRVVTLSWVGFASGARADLDALGALCRERGVYFVVDAIQGVGPMTLDLSRTPVDILSCGGQKWLLSPWGSGFVYVRRELVAALEPHDVSWMGVRGSDDFSRLVDYDLTWRESARRFEFITLPYQDFAGMNASLELIHEIGPQTVAAHVTGLAELIVRRAMERGIEIATPVEPSRRAGIISLRPGNARAVSERLAAARVIHSFREGGIRLSPHWYNTDAEVRRAMELIEG